MAREVGQFRLVSRPLAIGGEQFRLTGAYASSDIDEVLTRVREMFFVAIPLLLLCAATGGYMLARRSLAPVLSMAARAAEISASNMHERLPVGGGDELAGLARVVNGLLDRLEKSFTQQRRFVTAASPATVDVSLSRRNGHYEIRVTDSERGIPREAHERVFERFFRVDSARSRAENSFTSGAALGLSIARRIVEMHGGSMAVAESRPGHTELLVRLPAGA